MKNITPLQLSMLGAFIISFISALIVAFYNHLGGIYNLEDMLVFLVVDFIISFFVILIILERFVYRRIKLIYKIIHTLKTEKENRFKKISTLTDAIGITEAKVSEWAVSYQAEMEEMKNAEIYRKEFLSNVSHELKTPIFNIQGYIHTLIDGGLNDPQINTKYLEKAAIHLDQLSDMVNDLEIISRLEAGELPLNIKKFEIYHLAKDVMESLELQAKTNNIRLEFKPGIATGTMVTGDYEKIKQVLLNLLSNSIKYGKENGITQVSIYDMGENALIEITDDGIGISREHLPRLFERFYRVDKSRSRKGGGTGLGLAIVKHIIEAHNQTINVRSTLGIGSTFGFTLKKG